MTRLPALVFGFLTTIACAAERDDDPQAVCMPGASYACNCPDGGTGTATCGAEGFVGACMCAASTDSATTAPPSTGESGCTTGCGDTGSGADTGSGTSETGACPPIYAGRVDGITVPWTFAGQAGLAGGAAACASIGADHLCDYEEVLAADQAGEIDGVINTSAWIHRTTVATVEGVPSAPGPGGRCVDWTDGTGTLADGEWVELTADGLVYRLDADTFYDGLDASHTDPVALPCIDVARSVLCCNAACG